MCSLLRGFSSKTRYRCFNSGMSTTVTASIFASWIVYRLQMNGPRSWLLLFSILIRHCKFISRRSTARWRHLPPATGRGSLYGQQQQLYLLLRHAHRALLFQPEQTRLFRIHLRRMRRKWKQFRLEKRVPGFLQETKEGYFSRRQEVKQGKSRCCRLQFEISTSCF